MMCDANIYMYKEMGVFFNSDHVCQQNKHKKSGTKMGYISQQKNVY